MSGPVWQKNEAENAVCDKCLSKTDSSFQRGEVVDGEFRPLHTYCDTCYDENINLMAREA
ncbi:MAG: hypothetical protein GY906_37665 [bacterium]|nr:hypothetical protein [bacterium]